MVYLWLIVGFILLIKGADFFVSGSSSVARILRVPGVIIGLTIVAFGTSAPEAAVSITAAVSGNNEIAVGNVIGSNMFNLLMVIGFCGIIMPMEVNKKILYGDFLFSIIITGVLLTMMGLGMNIGRVDGLILVGMFIIYVAWTVRSALQKRVAAAEQADHTEELKNLSPLLCALYIFGGLVAIVAGGDLVVKCASEIAAAFGLSQTLIGLTIVAMGTSLPELVTSIVASRKGENGMAFGNVIGSNIFNILMVLGASTIIRPITVAVFSVYDMVLLLFVSVIGWLWCRTRYEVSRLEGITMIALYAGYMVYIILRDSGAGTAVI